MEVPEVQMGVSIILPVVQSDGQWDKRVFKSVGGAGLRQQSVCQ